MEKEKLRVLASSKETRKTFDAFYTFATENITAYINKFDLDGKSLLTVGSSSDQVFNAALYGSDDITLVDLCPFTKDFYYLKLSALMSLNRLDFIDFFRNLNKLPKITKYFKRVLPTLESLNSESADLWDCVFKTFKFGGMRNIMRPDTNLYRRDIMNFNPYLANDLKYERTKKSVENFVPTFILGDLRTTKFSRQFDNIWLSNVFQYTYEDIRSIAESMNEILDEHGLMLLFYAYIDAQADIVVKMLSDFDIKTTQIYNDEITYCYGDARVLTAGKRI